MREIKLTLGLCWLMFFGASIWNVYALANPPESNYPISKLIQYGFTLQNKTNHILEKAELWVYAPVKQTSSQYCTNLEASHPYQLITDDLNNQVLHFTFSNLAPYETKVIVIKAQLNFSDTSVPLPVDTPDAYLQPEEYIESNASEIYRLAAGFKTFELIDTAQNIFHWVADNIKYMGYVRNDRGALYALRNRQGDCTEFMYLFTALCRAKNIPARGLSGYVGSKDNILEPHDYHSWAEFYDSKAWKIADPQKNLFGQNQSSYITMRIIGPSPQNPMGKSHQFRVSGDGLTVTINKFHVSDNKF